MNKNNLKQFISFILLFCVLSIYTIYYNIEILKLRSETIINNNVEEQSFIGVNNLDNGSFISSNIYINKNLKEIYLRVDIDSPIQVELKQNNRKEIITLNVTKEDYKKITLPRDKFNEGILTVKLINYSGKPQKYYVNYPNKESGYIKLNDKETIHAYSIQMKQVYKGSDFYIISWILFIIIILLQFLITYYSLANDLKDNRIYWLTSLLLVLIAIFRFPMFTIWAEPIVETMNIFMNVNLQYNKSIIDMLLTTDLSMTYLPSIINIIGRILHIEENLVVYLHMSGIIIACLWIALLTRISLRKYLPDYIRVIIVFSILMLWNSETFFISSMFIYWGIFFIIYCYVLDLNKLTRKQFVFSMIMIFLIINGKMVYIVLAPIAVLFIFYFGLSNKRNLIMQIVIIVSSILNYLVYSIIVKDVIKAKSINLLDRIFDYKTTIAMTFDSIASIFNINIVTTKCAHMIAENIIIIISVYSIYRIIKDRKIINNKGTLIFILILSIFSISHIYNITNMMIYKANICEFNYIPIYRWSIFNYIITYMLVVVLITILYDYIKKTKYFKTASYVVIAIILVITSNWPTNANSITYLGLYTRVDSYQTWEQYRFRDYIKYFKNEYAAIPASMGGLNNLTKKSKMQCYDIVLDKEEDFNICYYNPTAKIVAFRDILNKYDFKKSSVKNKCIVSLYTSQMDMNYSIGKIKIIMYDQNNQIIKEQIQDNKKMYNQIGFHFDAPVCNVDYVEFYDEKNNIIYTSSKMVIGIATE